MSQFAPAPMKPDSRVFASYPMPAKIDLINERPRRESLLEQQLGNKIGQPQVPKIEVSDQQPLQQQQQMQHQFNNSWNQQRQQQQQHENQTSIRTNQQPVQHNKNYYYHEQQIINNSIVEPVQQAFNNQQMVQQNNQPQFVPNQTSQNQASVVASDNTIANAPNLTVTTTTTTTTTTSKKEQQAAIFAAELADKEAKLMAEINALHARPYSPFQVPDKIDLTNESRISQQQYQHAPSPRPFSRASSTKSTSADLMDKEAKLLQEIEEMEKKPYNPQTMIVEREQWFEYPEGKPYDKHLTDSKRRVKDFCSLPSHMYPKQGAYVHEDNIPASTLSRPSSSASSIHTTIIRSPIREVDNKSPLPFAFDNFSTKGVRGNLASVGAIEPDRPRPPIYPIIKRTPSPNMARG